LRKSRNVDPAVNSARARLANKHRYYPDQDHSDDKRALVAANIEVYLRKMLAEMPPLTDEQRTKLAELLKPARQRIAEKRIAQLDDRARIARRAPHTTQRRRV
jgi:hypothetical protein